MLRATLMITAVVATALVLPDGSVPARPVDRVAAQRLLTASVRVAECLTGPVPESRLAVFRGSMRLLPDSERMWMRFTLQERLGEGGFRTVRAPDLDVWHKSDPGVMRFAYRQRVLALAQGATYRAVVSFRWYAPDGELVHHVRRRSPKCRQPSSLPNLRITRIGGGRPVEGVAGAYRYTAHVSNRGRMAASGFGVTLAVDGATAGTVAVVALTPGESRPLRFTGPACEGSVSAVADAADTVRETSEVDNRVTLPCPTGP